jgi:hypothetical protein
MAETPLARPRGTVPAQRIPEMNRKLTRRAAVLAAAAFLSGCYSYAPAQLTAVPAGEDVRITLTRRGQLELSERSSSIDEVVQGTFLGQTGDEVLISVPLATRQEGFFRSDITQELPIPAREIVAIDLRRFDAGKTALFVGGIAGGSALVVGLIIAASADPVGPGDGGIEEIRVPLFNVPAR